MFNCDDIFAAYRNSEYSASKHLDKIEDPGIQELLGSMLERNPSNRKSAEIYLSQARAKVFPEYFYSFLQSYMLIFSAAPILSPDEKINRLKKDIGNIINILRAEENVSRKSISEADKTESGKNSQENVTNVEVSKEEFGLSEDNTIVEGDSDQSSEKCDSHTGDTKDSAKVLEGSNEVKNESVTNPANSCSENVAGDDQRGNKLKSKDDVVNDEDDGESKSSDTLDGLIIITQLVTSCIRGLHHSQSKLQSLEILLELAENTSDETILDRILPYIVSKNDPYLTLVS